MSPLIAAELLKLRLTRATWGFAAVPAVLAALRMYMVVASAGTAAGVGKGTTTAILTLFGAAGLGTLALVLLGATAVTGEFRHATITATLVNTPHRRSLIMAKFAAYAMVGAALSLVLVIGAVAVAVATGLAGPLDATVVYAAVATLVGGVILTSLGVAVGLLIPHQSVALVVPVVWFLVVEPLTRAFHLTFLTPWLPGTLLGELGPWDSAASLPPVVAAAVLALYVSVLGVLGARRLQRADIS